MASDVLHASSLKPLGVRKRLACALCACIVAGLAIAVLGFGLAPLANATDFASKNLAPSFAHLFGTDWMGRDMFARTICGLGISGVIGLLSSLLAGLIAFVLAAIAALCGSRARAVVSWLTDLVMGIPHIVLLILISYAMGRGAMGVAVGVALTHWTSLARVLQTEMLQCLSQPYVQASRALGVSRVKLLITHVLPAILPQLACGMVLAFPHAILHEASITFLGFGLSPDWSAIGVILSESMGYLSAGVWWLAFFPGFSLAALVLLLNHVAALIRQTTDAATVQE